MSPGLLKHRRRCSSGGTSCRLRRRRRQLFVSSLCPKIRITIGTSDHQSAGLRDIFDDQGAAAFRAVRSYLLTGPPLAQSLSHSRKLGKLSKQDRRNVILHGSIFA